MQVSTSNILIDISEIFMLGRLPGKGQEVFHDVLGIEPLALDGFEHLALFAVSLSSNSSVKPSITPTGLLISWSTPAARVPREASFFVCVI
jgi:hypothetical protein